MKIFNNFKNYRNNIALISDKFGFIKFNEIDKFVKKLEKKIQNKSLILIITKNSIGSILSYIFSMKTDNTAMLVDEKTNLKYIKNIIKIYKPNYIFLPKDNELKNNKSGFGFYDYFFFQSNKQKIEINKNIKLLLSTSGTTGSTKYVKLSNQNLLTNSKSIIKYLKIKKHDRSITNMPMAYSYMISIINTHLEIGGSIICNEDSMLQKEFWSKLRKYSATSFNCVPYIFETMGKKIMSMILKTKVKYITQAGGPLNKEMFKEIASYCRENKLKFFSMYGQTEGSPRIAYLDPKYSLKKLNSIGKPIPGVKLYIKKKKEIIRKPFVIGELYCEGKNIFLGYSRSGKDLNKINSVKILKTGDLAYFDEDKFFFITGRKNRIAKVIGLRIDINDLEYKLKKYNYNFICMFSKSKIFLFHEKKYNQRKVLTKLNEISNINDKYWKLKKIRKFPITMNKKINYRKLEKMCV